jgi:hypothetical protein
MIGEPLDRDEVIFGKDGTRIVRTVCGYCDQHRHNQCRGYNCACGENNHRLQSLFR